MVPYVPAAFSKAIELAPNLPEAHNNLGIVFAMRGETGQAMRHFEQGLALDPRDATAHFNLGLLLAKQGRTADAIGRYEEAIRLDPGYEDARRALAAARRPRGRG